jgi:hypothetical protein
MNIIVRFLFSWVLAVVCQFLLREIQSDFPPFVFTCQFFVDILWLGGVTFILQVLWSLFWIEKQLRKPSISPQAEVYRSGVNQIGP